MIIVTVITPTAITLFTMMLVTIIITIIKTMLKLNVKTINV